MRAVVQRVTSASVTVGDDVVGRIAEPGLLVLPAFGEFTGGHAVPAAPGRQRFAVGAGRVWALP